MRKSCVEATPQRSNPGRIGMRPHQFRARGLLSTFQTPSLAAIRKDRLMHAKRFALMAARLRGSMAAGAHRSQHAATMRAATDVRARTRTSELGTPLSSQP